MILRAEIGLLVAFLLVFGCLALLLELLLPDHPEEATNDSL
jgi:hypothetical protein